MTTDEQLRDLRAKLEASKRMGSGYADRVAFIQKRIDEIEAQNDEG